MPRAGLTRLTMRILLSGIVPAFSPAADPSARLRDIRVSFMLDPRLVDSTYAGQRWVSPATYLGAGGQNTVEARALGVDGKGRPAKTTLEWIPSDPQMVTVSPSQGDRVKITVHRAGESRLRIAAQGFSRAWVVRAKDLGQVLQVEITQPPPGKSDGASVQTVLRNQQAASRAEDGKRLAEKNRQEGEAFLADNKKRERVVSLPSGLQYKVVKAGMGKRPTAEDAVVCQYRGAFVDGTVFDNTYKRGGPVSFPVKVVIKGWAEALQLMPVGSKWQLFIPPELAYGARGAGGRSNIGPNTTLLFELELIAISEHDRSGGPATAAAIPARANEH